MKDLNLNHWLMLSTSTSPKRAINFGFVYLAAIFACAYIATSIIN